MPCFNEAGKIGDLLASMPASVAGRRLTFVVVDDGSSDASVEEVLRCQDASGEGDRRDLPEIQLIQLSQNRGKGAALRLAMDVVRSQAFDAVVWMDSDGQHAPDSLVDLISPVLEEGIDLCVGSRYLNGGHSGKVPLNRRIVRWASVWAVSKITGFAVSDPYSGFRCFSRSAFGALELEGDGYEAELESCFSIARAGLGFREVPIPRIYGPGTSKMGYHHGALRGRFEVVVGYSRTIYGAWSEGVATSQLPVHT